MASRKKIKLRERSVSPAAIITKTRLREFTVTMTKGSSSRIPVLRPDSPEKQTNSRRFTIQPVAKLSRSEDTKTQVSSKKSPPRTGNIHKSGPGSEETKLLRKRKRAGQSTSTTPKSPRKSVGRSSPVRASSSPSSKTSQKKSSAKDPKNKKELVQSARRGRPLKLEKSTKRSPSSSPSKKDQKESMSSTGQGRGRPLKRIAVATAEKSPKRKKSPSPSREKSPKQKKSPSPSPSSSPYYLRSKPPSPIDVFASTSKFRRPNVSVKKSPSGSPQSSPVKKKEVLTESQQKIKKPSTQHEAPSAKQNRKRKIEQIEESMESVDSELQKIKKMKLAKVTITKYEMHVAGGNSKKLLAKALPSKNFEFSLKEPSTNFTESATPVDSFLAKRSDRKLTLHQRSDGSVSSVQSSEMNWDTKNQLLQSILPKSSALKTFVTPVAPPASEDNVQRKSGILFQVGIF